MATFHLFRNNSKNRSDYYFTNYWSLVIVLIHFYLFQTERKNN